MDKTTRVFHIDGTDYVFSFDHFTTMFRQHSHAESCNCRQMEEKLADAVFVSRDAVRNWRRRKNGMDLDIIKRIGVFWNIDYMKLLVEKKEGKYTTMTGIYKLSDIQYSSVQRVYGAIIDFLDELLMSDGLFSYGNDHHGAERADKAYHVVEVKLEKEYLLLAKHPIYDEFIGYVQTDLLDSYEGKVTEDVRYEFDEPQSVAASDDYDKALNLLHKIVKPYLC